MYNKTNDTQFLKENKGLINILTKRLRYNKTVVAQKLDLNDIKNIVKFSLFQARELQEKDLVTNSKPKYALGTYAYIRCLYNVKNLHSITTTNPASVVTKNWDIDYDGEYLDRGMRSLENKEIFDLLNPSDYEILRLRYIEKNTIEKICSQYNLTYLEYTNKINKLKQQILEMIYEKV